MVHTPILSRRAGGVIHGHPTKENAKKHHANEITHHGQPCEDSREELTIIDNQFSGGSYGKILLAKDKNENQVVIKKINYKVSTRMVMNEVKAGKLLVHPNIVKFRKYYMTGDSHCLVLDYASGADLFTLMEVMEFAPLYEEECKLLFKQLLHGLQHCHAKGIAHRDIKLENLIVDIDKKLTILDFGLCSITSSDGISRTKCHDFCDFLCACCSDSKHEYLEKEYVGSDNYVSPEVIKNIPYCPFKTDMWSCGIVLYCLLHGSFPWHHKRRVNTLLDNLPHPVLEFPARVNISNEAKDLIRKLLTVNPVERISLSQVMNHPWVMTH